MRRIALGLAALLSTTVAISALAQEGPKKDGPPPPPLREMDINQDGNITREEAAEFSEITFGTPDERALKHLDKNGDGVISADERPSFDKIFEALDADGDDIITREEAEAGRLKRNE